jgi:uncharacterized membrane protein YkvA (DUF1232 family)
MRSTPDTNRANCNHIFVGTRHFTQNKMKKQPFSTVFLNLYRKALKHTKYRWVVIFGTLLYLVSPLDISPDVFPILGWIDDGVVVSLLVAEVSSLMGEQLKRKRQSDSQSATAFDTTSDDDNIPTITVDAVSVS